MLFTLPLGKGTQGRAAFALQMGLHDLGYDNEGQLTPDGDWAGNTDAALKSYQSDHDLPVTGVLDEATLKTLSESLEYDLNGIPETAFAETTAVVPELASEDDGEPRDGESASKE